LTHGKVSASIHLAKTVLAKLTEQTMSRLCKKMSETTKAERKESVDKINAASVSYGIQRERLLKQAAAATDLADSLESAYTRALAVYLPTPEAQTRLQALAEAYNEAVRAADKSNSAASGFKSLQRAAKEEVATIQAAEATLPLGMREHRVFNVMKVIVYTNGNLNYGLHETMLKADQAYAKALALAAEGQSA
jgi:hypothetical protein